MPLWEGVVPFGSLIGVILLAFVTFWLFRTAVREKQRRSRQEDNSGGTGRHIGSSGG